MLILLLVVASLVGWWVFESGRRRRHPVPEGHQKDIEIPHGREDLRPTNVGKSARFYD